MAGGWDRKEMTSVEILDQGSDVWRKGPDLPIPVFGAAMVEHPSGGVVLIGGKNAMGPKDEIYYLPFGGKAASWELMPVKLKMPRAYHTAMLVPDKVANSCHTDIVIG